MIAPLLLALATLGWLAAGLYYGSGMTTSAGLMVLALGASLAAWAARDASRKGPAVGGLALAFVGVLLFLGPGLGEIQGAGSLAGHAFALGLALAALARQLERDALARVAWSIAALGALLWTWSDFEGGASAWQPGNVAAFVAACWLALRPSA